MIDVDIGVYVVHHTNYILYRQEMKATVNTDTARRLQALHEATVHRQQVLAATTSASANPLTAELHDYHTGERKLRRTGGVDEVERMRRVREAEVLDVLMEQLEE